VSDNEFLPDFDQLENVTDVDYLKSSVSLSTTLGGWQSRLLFDEYQTINLSTSVADRPYKRLPRLTLDRAFEAGSSGLTLNWNNEYVRFDKDDSITGQRLHIKPVIGYSLEGDAYFIKPRVQLDYTQYQLDDNLAVSDIERSIPLYSIDSGLIFERLAGSTGDWIQTLEPRLYLLYVPYEDQSDIPDFDTSLLDESFSNLFINNRFSGGDRIGDAQQASVGITSRLYRSQSGEEVLRTSIGQAFYGHERRVSLSNSVDERDKSGLIGEIRYRPVPIWDIQLRSVYDEQLNQFDQNDIALRRHEGEQIFNLEYHFRNDSLEQTTLSLVYPLTSTLTGFAKHQYSQHHDIPVQYLLGLNYESCCWGLTMLFEESSDKDFTKTDKAVYFQFTFKGLSSAGKDLDAILEEGILGYHR
jgi:LPS-assembly protein